MDLPEPDDRTMHDLKWFMERIGERIYRDKTSCDCDECKQILNEGLVIMDGQHANYLYTCQNDYAHDGIFLNYREVK